MDFHPIWVRRLKSRARRMRRVTRRGKTIVSKASWATSTISAIPKIAANILMSSFYSSLHLLPTFSTARRTGQSTAASVSRSRSAITTVRQIEATSRFVPCANNPTATKGTLTPL